MKNQVHHNYIKASDLILITIGLGIINIFLSPAVFSTSFSVIVAIFTLLLMLANAILIRKGYNWAKILFTILFGLGLFGIPLMVKTLAENPIVGVINIIQTVLQIWAVVLLFRIPNTRSVD